jgi:hypothetical protein
MNRFSVWQDPIEKHGFAIIPEVLIKEEVSNLLEDIRKTPALRTRAGIRHSLGLAAVGSLARQARLLEIAHSILGADAIPFRATLFDKSPSANWLVVWHQDTALPLRERRETPGWGAMVDQSWRDLYSRSRKRSPPSASSEGSSRRLDTGQWATSRLAGNTYARCIER